MSFEAVQVHDLDGKFLGYAIKKEGAVLLHSLNIWTESPEEIQDLQEQLSRLNDQRAVLAFWPDVRDPEVQELLDDKSWEPLPLSPQQIVDEDKSIFAWIEPPSEENPYGRMDEENSIIVHKTVMVPAPTDVQQRVKKACELVARRRAAAHGEG